MHDACMHHLISAASSEYRKKLDKLYDLDHNYMQQKIPLEYKPSSEYPPSFYKIADPNYLRPPREYIYDFDRKIFSEISRANPYTLLYSREKSPPPSLIGCKG